MQNPSEFYSAQLLILNKKLADLSNKSTAVSLSRGGLALLAAVAIYAGFSFSNWIFIPAFLFVSVFLYFVKRSTIINRELDTLKKIIELNQDELAFLKGDKSVFDQGTHIDIKGHLFALDLDVFGKGSLFQSLNRTTTKEGRHHIITSLLNPPANLPEIEARRETIEELTPLMEWRQRFYGVGYLSNEPEHNAEEMALWTASPQFFKNRKYWLAIAGVMSVVLSVLIIWMILTTTFHVAALVVVIFNSIVLRFLAKDIKAYFQLFGKRTDYFNKFSELFALVDEQDFTSPLGAELKQKASEASAAFRKLSSLSNAADQRLGVFGPVMNSLFYLDIWNISKIEGWREAHGPKVTPWIYTLAQVDMLNSFANFSFNHPSFTTAHFSESGNHIRATKVGHPLIPEATAVKNDYEIGIKTTAHIITGSNMAGKSTFIRGIGLNMLLAMNGAPVCAESFTCSVLQIVTCIRIADSLEEDASYFKAELTRLEQVVTVLKNGNPCLVLLDEILRGTNSDDKRFGTMSFYKKLVNYNCLALLATHDLSVGQLANDDPAHFENYCFESAIVNEELTFDYKLRHSISSSANASFLMRKMGLID